MKLYTFVVTCIIFQVQAELHSISFLLIYIDDNLKL